MRAFKFQSGTKMFRYRLLNRLRHLWAGWGARAARWERGVLEERLPRLLAGTKASAFPPEPVSVHMLLSGRSFLMGLWAAKSFQHFTGRNWKMVFHDDGSLTEAQRQTLARQFPEGWVWDRKDANHEVENRLSEYPRCLGCRRKNIMFLKLFDPFFCSEGDRFILLDSDVLFFAEPGEVLEWAGTTDPGFWFNPDPNGSYSVPAEDLEAYFGVPIWDRVNAGFSLIPKAGVDLDVIERYLAEFAHQSTHDAWLEQTAYALLASLYDKGGLLPPSYEISFEPKRKAGCIARHYVGLETSRPHFFREGVVGLAPLLLVD